MAAVRRRERDVTEENGVTTTTTVKRRKMEEEEVESRIILSPCVQTTSRGGTVERNSAGASETSVVIVRRRDSSIDQEDLDHVSSVSCCYSNNNYRSDEKSKRRIEFLDVEENNGDDLIGTSWIYDNFNKRNVNELYMTEESSVNMDSSSTAAMEIQTSEDVESRCRLRMKKTTVKEAELEDFFQSAEKDVRNKMLECSMKYNFDFEKEEPLGGRYEWVKLNP